MGKMNMKKKFPLRLLGAILAALLVLAVFPISALAEDGIELVLDVDKETAIEGDEVTVTVKIGESNSGIASMCFDLKYDKDVFALKENSAVILGDFASEAGWLDLMEERQGVDNITAVNPQDGKVTFNWIYNGALNGQTNYEGTNTDFAKLVFTVKEGVTENKDINFVLKPSEENIFSIKDNMPSVPVSGYTSEKTIVKSVAVKKSYTVTYYENGGNGAPSAQTKTKGTALKLSSTVPTKTGYTFKHWQATDGTTYAPGANYTKDEGTTLSAVWQRNASTLAVGNSVGVAGGTVIVPVTVGGETMSATKVELTVTAEGLTLLENDGWALEGSKISKTFNPAKVFQNGSKLVNLKFEIPQDAKVNAEYTVSITAEVDDYNFAPQTTAGTVTVMDYILGDVNGDNEVDAYDLTALARHLGKIETITDSKRLSASDVTKDGEVDAYDLTKLARYLGKIDSEF